MKVLLDTHIWIWSLLEPEKLSPKIARILKDPRTEIWISPISLWEIFGLARKGRLNLAQDPATWISSVLKGAPLREATFTHDVALAMQTITLPHRDPADHFLAATAKVYGLTLVTADGNLLMCKDYSVIDGR